MSGRRAWLFAGGLVAGGLAGFWMAQQRLTGHRDDLFSPRPLRRLAALGYLAGHASIETVRLLRDYLEWESSPLLRRRAQAMLLRMEPRIG